MFEFWFQDWVRVLSLGKDFKQGLVLNQSYSFKTLMVFQIKVSRMGEGFKVGIQIRVRVFNF